MDGNGNNTTTTSFTEKNLHSKLLHAPYFELYWLVSEFILIFLTIITIYLLICLLHYAATAKCRPGREITGSKKGKTLFQMCLISVFMAIGRLVADQVVALYGWQSDGGCSIGVAASAVFYSLSLYPAYIFLWLRQNIFYSSPVLSHVLNPLINTVSWVTLVVMLLGGAIITAFYTIPEINGWKYVASQTGCRDVADLNGFELLPTVLVCFTVAFQLSLLCLFIYPLLSKKTRRYRRLNKTGKNIKRENSTGSDGNDVEFSQHCCSTDNGGKVDVGEEKLMGDSNFEAEKCNVSVRDSFISKDGKRLSLMDMSSKNSSSVGFPIVQNSNDFYNQDTAESFKNKKDKNSKNSTLLFELIKRPRTISLYSKTGLNKSRKVKR